MRNEFEKLYRKFRHPIYHYVSSRMSDPHLAEEVTQEVFLKAFRSHDSFDHRFNVSTWLWTIARNTVTDFFRRAPTMGHFARGAYLPGPADADDEAGIESFPCPNLDPERTLILRAERLALSKVIAGLTDLQKKALSLHLIQRLSYREIAAQLGISLSATKALVHRARRAVSLHGAPLGALAYQTNT